MSKSKPKSKTIKVPKRVAGVKIPKAVRKGPVLQFVNSSAGKLLVAEAITAALAALAAKNSRSADLEGAMKQNASRLTRAFGEGVRAFRQALAEAPAGDEGDLESPIVAADEAPAASKKGYRRTSPTASPI